MIRPFPCVNGSQAVKLREIDGIGRTVSGRFRICYDKTQSEKLIRGFKTRQQRPFSDPRLGGTGRPASRTAPRPVRCILLACLFIPNVTQ